MSVPDDFDFDLWADMAHEMKLKGVKPETVLPSDESLKLAEPESPYDPQEDFESLLETISEEIYENEGVRLSIGREAIWAFASRIWEAAEDAAAEDISKCCGCSGSDKELNPFKERRESHQ